VSGVRVAVTGVGTISPLGLDAGAHFDRLSAGASAVERLDDPAYRAYPPMLHSAVHGFDRRTLVPDRMLRKLLSPSPSFALAAAAEALRDAGLAGADLAECGLYAGSVCLDADPEAFIPALRESVDSANNLNLSRFATHGIKLVDPLFLVKSLPNAGLCGIAIQYQVLGPNANITNGSVSGLQAVIAAVDALRRGEAEMALAGGYDSLLRMDCIVDHLLAGRLTADRFPPGQACRPFDRQRSGYALAEGAAFVMLETLERARRREAPIYGELLGTGQSAFPKNLLDPSPDDEGLITCAGQALDAAGGGAGIDVVFGDGLANAIDDGRELRACRTLFPGRRIPLTAFTGSIGFPGAAAGAFSLVHALLGMRRGLIPPTVNCDDPVESDGVDLVAAPRRARPRGALVWTSDRGIKNAAVVAAALET
jgi:3-oxoacyl-[acyl-carrier-protein] synthase II